MKAENAEKKLTANGFTAQNEGGHSGWAWVHPDHPDFVLEYLVDRDGTVTCIRVRHQHDHDDSMSDYSAGAWFDTITRAIRHMKGSYK